MEVDLGAIAGGPHRLFFLSLSFRNGVHLRVRIWLVLGLDWAWIGLLGAACFQNKCLRMRGKRESKFCASHNSQRHLGVGGF